MQSFLACGENSYPRADGEDLLGQLCYSLGKMFAVIDEQQCLLSTKRVKQGWAGIWTRGDLLSKRPSDGLSNYVGVRDRCEFYPPDAVTEICQEAMRNSQRGTGLADSGRSDNADQSGS